MGGSWKPYKWIIDSEPHNLLRAQALLEQELGITTPQQEPIDVG